MEKEKRLEALLIELLEIIENNKNEQVKRLILKMRIRENLKIDKTFNYEQVRDIIYSVYDYYNIFNSDKFKMNFERRLNDKGRNGNNGTNEDKQEEFEKDNIESFIC